MKTTLNTSIAILALALTGCNSISLKAETYRGRLIEFKSDSTGFDTRTFFYEGKSEVVAFDSQFTPDLAKQSINYLRKFTNKPITWLIITHPNPDKFNGTSVFKMEGARVLSSQSTSNELPGVQAYKEFYFVEIAKMFKKGEYPQLTPIDLTFNGQMDLILRGGEKIQIKELAQPGVSSTQSIAYIPAIKSLIVGDLIHYKAHAWLEGGIVNGTPKPTINGWISDLKELASNYPHNSVVYGGRGNTSDLNTTVFEQIRYLQLSEDLIRKHIKSLGAKAQDFKGPNAGVLYKALAKKFQTYFPDYKYPYMIEYGSYGLVQAELNSN